MSRVSRYAVAISLLLLTAVLPLLPAGPSGADAAATCLGRAVTVEGQPGTAVTGTPGDDVILATYGSSGSVRAGAGDDVVCVLPGSAPADPAAPAYPVKGGGGEDTIVLDVTSDIEVVEVKLDRSATWGDVELALGGLEDVVVTAHRAVVYGTKADNRLVVRTTDGALVTGKDGDDLLVVGDVPDGLSVQASRIASGGPGDDRLRGSPFGDVLTGGPGRDKAVGRAGRDVCTAEVRRSCELR